MYDVSFCNSCGKAIEQGRIHCDACSTANSSPAPAAGPATAAAAPVKRSGAAPSLAAPARKKAPRGPRRRPTPARRRSSGALGGVIGIGILLAIFVPMHSRIIDAAIRLVEGRKSAPAKEKVTGESGPGYRIVRRPLPGQARPAVDVARRGDQSKRPKRPAEPRQPSPRRPRPAPPPPPDVVPMDDGLRPPARPTGLPLLPPEHPAATPAAPQPAAAPAPAPLPEELVTLGAASFSFHTTYKRVLTDRHRPPGQGVPGVADRVRVYEKVPVSTKVTLRVRFDVPEDLDGLYEIWVHAPELGLVFQTILIPEEVEKGKFRFKFTDVIQGGPPSKIRSRSASQWPKNLEWGLKRMSAEYGS